MIHLEDLYLLGDYVDFVHVLDAARLADEQPRPLHAFFRASASLDWVDQGRLRLRLRLRLRVEAEIELIVVVHAALRRAARSSRAALKAFSAPFFQIWS